MHSADGSVQDVINKGEVEFHKNVVPMHPAHEGRLGQDFALQELAGGGTTPCR
jgi:hypothetical protein